MEQELQDKLLELITAYHKSDKSIGILSERMNGLCDKIEIRFNILETKIDKMNGVATILESHETSISFLTKGFWVGLTGLFTVFIGVVF